MRAITPRMSDRYPNNSVCNRSEVVATASSQSDIYALGSRDYSGITVTVFPPWEVWNNSACDVASLVYMTARNSSVFRTGVLELLKACDSNNTEWTMTSPVCSTKFGSFGMFLLVTIVLLVITLWTVLGNALVLLALYRFRTLRTMSNCLIGNLAVSDLLLALTVLPISTGRDLLGYWVFGQSMCTIWLIIDVLYCTASIWGLCTIAVDRYTATVYPVWYHDRRSTKKALGYIGFVWVFSIIISLAPIIGWQGMIQSFYRYSPNINRYDCILFSTKSYVIYSAMGSFIIPFCLMTFLYVQIFIVLHKQSSKARKRKNISVLSQKELAENCPRIDVTESTGCNHVIRDITTSTIVIPDDEREDDDKESCKRIEFNLGGDRDNWSDKQDDAPNIYSRSKNEANVSLIRDHRSNSLKVELETFRTDLSFPAPQAKEFLSVSTCDIPWNYQLKKSRSASTSLQQNGNSSISQCSSSCPLGVATKRSKSATMLYGMADKRVQHPERNGNSRSYTSIHRFSLPWQMERHNHMTTSMRRRFQMREQRATKRMLLIMASFFVCWVPFTTMYMLRSLCPQCRHLDEHVTAFIIWLGYANSALNPVLYPLFNDDFRRAFKKILTFSTRDRPSRFK